MVKSFEEISKLLKESLSMNAARAKALTLIIFAMINCETVNMSKLSKHLKSDIKQASGYKRLQRFMKEVIFDQTQLARILLSFTGIEDNEKLKCQYALKIDPLCASKIDPPTATYPVLFLTSFYIDELHI